MFLWLTSTCTDVYISRPVDLLLGADIYSEIIQEGIKVQGIKKVSRR